MPWATMNPIHTIRIDTGKITAVLSAMITDNTTNRVVMWPRNASTVRWTNAHHVEGSRQGRRRVRSTPSPYAGRTGTTMRGPGVVQVGLSPPAPDRQLVLPWAGCTPQRPPADERRRDRTDPDRELLGVLRGPGRRGTGDGRGR